MKQRIKRNRGKRRRRKREPLDYRILRNIPLHRLTREAFYNIAYMILKAKPVKPWGNKNEGRKTF